MTKTGRMPPCTQMALSLSSVESTGAGFAAAAVMNKMSRFAIGGRISRFFRAPMDSM